MIGALARQVKDGDRAACGTLSPLPAAALDAQRRRLLFGPVKEKLAQTYPRFAARLQKSPC